MPLGQPFLKARSLGRSLGSKGALSRGAKGKNLCFRAVSVIQHVDSHRARLQRSR